LGRYSGLSLGGVKGCGGRGKGTGMDVYDNQNERMCDDTTSAIVQFGVTRVLIRVRTHIKGWG
jgi:hypothetical protein